MKTKYGLQRAHAYVLGEGRTTELAEEIGVTRAQLVLPIYGRCRPNPRIRAALPRLVGVPLEDLFTEEALVPSCACGRPPKIAHSQKADVN